MSTITSKLDPVLYTEGMLYKRQRGLKQGNAKKLKFQERFCRLTSTSLDYYDPNPKKRSEGPKGQFAVEQIKIVEEMEREIFGKEYPYAFQIGDNTEIMYFVAKTMKEMEEWLSACRHVSSDAGNTPLTHHHHGVFGLVNKGRWSCCANPRRACPGCSPTTSVQLSPGANRDESLMATLPVRLTPPTKRNPQSPPIFVKTGGKESPNSPHVRTATPTVRFDDSDDSEGEAPPVSTPKIRRFTLADPLMMMPGTTKKLKELRKANSEKEGEREEENEEELALQGKENSTTSSNSDLNSDMTTEERNTKNTINSMDSKGEVTKKEGEDLSSNELQRHSENVNKSKETPSASLEKEKELKNQKSQMVEGKSQLVANCKKRTGADSPSPSVDSGRGVSRPNSQIDVSDLRVSRTESVGKKSVQSVISDQGVEPDEGKQAPCKEKAIIEETDSPSKQLQSGEISLVKIRTSSSSRSEEKYRDHGSLLAEDRIKERRAKRASLDILSSPMYSGERKHSAPQELDHSRPVSYAFTENDSIESDISKSVTPQHRKLLANMSVNSPKAERPRSTLVTLEGQYTEPYSPLHQACKDGNLLMLSEEIGNRGAMMNLDAPSNSPIPHTPLFIAYINDHFQTMVKLLEHGANPNIEEPREKASLLQWACEKGCLDIADLLIKYKADVNKRDSGGNTPLMAACKNGHFEVVELLLENGANVDDDNKSQRTALHEATEGEHTDITELLLKQSEVDPSVRDDKDLTPYDIAYYKKNEELMVMLQLAFPKEVRPYSLLVTNTNAASQMITSLVFKETDTIITGSRDCHVRLFNVSDLSEKHSVRVTDTVLDLSVYGGNHLLLGSTSIQLVDLDSPEKRRTVADDTQEDENLQDPPLHLAKFGPKGHMVTGSVENVVVKLWSPVTQTTGHIMHPETIILVREDKYSIGSIYSLSISPNPNTPWLAVGVQPGKLLTPDGFKLVYCYDQNTRKLHHIFDAGDGGLGVGVHTTFNPDGKQLAIGCSEHLCIWETKTGNLLQKFTISNNASINCLCYSPNGAHLAVGLSSGEVQVFEILSSSPIFYIPPTDNLSPVTAVTYSSSGKIFASGYKNGTLRLWEAHIGDVRTVS